MPEDYKTVVFAAYEEKKKAGKLSPNLLNPTPGDIREECLAVYRKRPDPKDDEILELFFRNEFGKKGYLTILEGSYAAKFRQVPRILAGEVPNPNIRYIELLAWLIDFQPRPSTSYYKSFYTTPGTESEQLPTTETDIDKKQDLDTSLKDTAVSDEEKVVTAIPGQQSAQIDLPGAGDQPGPTAAQPFSGIGKDSTGAGNAGNDEGVPPRQASKNKLPMIMIVCIIVLLAGRGVFYLWEESITKIRLPLADEHCMYWMGNHYEPIKCDVLADNVSIVPLNLQTLKRLKKIRHPERLTKSDLGKVWYAKIQGEPEYFTDSGMHPVDTLKRLRPLTPYILDKNITRSVFLSSVLGWLYYLMLFLLFSALVVNYFRRK